MFFIISMLKDYRRKLILKLSGQVPPSQLDKRVLHYFMALPLFFICLFIHSFINSFIHPFIHSFVIYLYLSIFLKKKEKSNTTFFHSIKSFALFCEKSKPIQNLAQSIFTKPPFLQNLFNFFLIISLFAKFSDCPNSRKFIRNISRIFDFGNLFSRES